MLTDIDKELGISSRFLVIETKVFWAGLITAKLSALFYEFENTVRPLLYFAL